MRKVLYVLLAVGVVLALSACDAKVSSSGTTSGGGSSSAAEPANKTEFALGEGIKVDDAVMTVVSGKQWKGGQFDKADAGKVFYIVNVKIENGGQNPVDYNEFNYKIENANGVQTDAAIVMGDVPDKMGSGSLAPGGKLNANLVFQVPKDMKGLKLVMEPNFFSDQQVKIVLTK